jgi:hypothetical protein
VVCVYLHRYAVSFETFSTQHLQQLVGSRHGAIEKILTSHTSSAMYSYWTSRFSDLNDTECIGFRF